MLLLNWRELVMGQDPECCLLLAEKWAPWGCIHGGGGQPELEKKGMEEVKVFSSMAGIGNSQKSPCSWRAGGWLHGLVSALGDHMDVTMALLQDQTLTPLAADVKGTISLPAPIFPCFPGEFWSGADRANACIWVSCRKVTWIRPCCTAGSAIPACIFLPTFPDRSQASTGFGPVSGVATPCNHKQAT